MLFLLRKVVAYVSWVRKRKDLRFCKKPAIHPGIILYAVSLRSGKKLQPPRCDVEDAKKEKHTNQLQLASRRQLNFLLKIEQSIRFNYLT